MRRRVVGALRRAWPAGALWRRGDGPFRTPEVHPWGERQEPGVLSILGQRGQAVLKRHTAG
jgi:hypothetical protein